MIKIQVISKYIALSEEGLAKRIECPIDQGLLASNLDFEDKAYLYCLSCSYKKYVGLDLYDQMWRAVEKLHEYRWDIHNKEHAKWKENNPHNDIKWWSV